LRDQSIGHVAQNKRAHSATRERTEYPQGRTHQQGLPENFHLKDGLCSCQNSTFFLLKIRDICHEFAINKNDDGEKEFSMNDKPSLDAEQLRKIREDLLDSIDEELEMSMEDGEDENSPHASPEEKQARATYFRELLRLQGELVKLQDWVVATKQKVVILFEGRDAAGKGGVIKRITQRLNPTRVPGHRPARSQRPRTHAVVLSALRSAPARSGRNCVVRPQLVQPRWGSSG
jgi:hypothetical protein